MANRCARDARRLGLHGRGRDLAGDRRLPNGRLQPQRRFLPAAASRADRRRPAPERMSWLPLTASDGEAVLALQPEAGALLRDALALSWRIADPELLRSCRARMAV